LYNSQPINSLQNINTRTRISELRNQIIDIWSTAANFVRVCFW